MGNTITGGVAATDGALCSLADVKLALNMTGTEKDALVEDIIEAAQAMIQEKTGYTLIATEHTEYFSPGHRGGNVSSDLTTLKVKEHPVISVTSVHDDPYRVYGADTLIDSSDYFNDDYTIQLYDDQETLHFDGGQRTVKAVYRAGYENIPADLQRAAVMLSVHLYYKMDRQRQGIASESLGDATVTYLDQAMPKEVIEMLKPYTKPMGL